MDDQWKKGHYESVCLATVKKGDLEYLKKLRLRNPSFELPEGMCREAAANGYLHTLQWLRLPENGPCYWNAEVCTYAAGAGQLEVLQWMRSCDPPCPWDETVCSHASCSNYFEITQWARAQNPPCPWGHGTCFWAVWFGRLDILQWARTQDSPCPWNISQIITAVRCDHVNIFSWIICCELEEIPLHVPGADYYNIIYSVHTLAVMELLEETYDRTAVPKDVMLLIGEYADVRWVMFDKVKKTLARNAFNNPHYKQYITPQLIAWLDSLK